MAIQPLGDRVLVKRLEAEETKRSHHRRSQKITEQKIGSYIAFLFHLWNKYVILPMSIHFVTEVN